MPVKSIGFSFFAYRLKAVVLLCLSLWLVLTLVSVLSPYARAVYCGHLLEKSCSLS